MTYMYIMLQYWKQQLVATSNEKKKTDNSCQDVKKQKRLNKHRDCRISILASTFGQTLKITPCTAS